jgi:E3 SUMO-protein ligase PIAS1
VRVNNLGLTANLKGLKKKPGTAPPPDLGKLVRLTPGATNRVEMVYVNSQQPVHGKVSRPAHANVLRLTVNRSIIWW